MGVSVKVSPTRLMFPFQIACMFCKTALWHALGIGQVSAEMRGVSARLFACVLAAQASRSLSLDQCCLSQPILFDTRSIHHSSTKVLSHFLHEADRSGTVE